MISPKEKAEEIVDRFSEQTYKYQPYAGATYVTQEVGYEAGIKCAIVSVNETISALENYDHHTEQYLKEQGVEYFSCELQNMEADFRYWTEVKNELEKML